MEWHHHHHDTHHDMITVPGRAHSNLSRTTSHQGYRLPPSPNLTPNVPRLCYPLLAGSLSLLLVPLWNYLSALNPTSHFSCPSARHGSVAPSLSRDRSHVDRRCLFPVTIRSYLPY